MAIAEVSLRVRGARRHTSILRRLAAAAATILAVASAYVYLWACRRVGPHARTLGRPKVRHEGEIEIGRDALIDSRAARVELSADPGGRLVIGDGVRIGAGARLVAARYVEIGDRASIGARCVVSDGGAEEAGPAEDPGIWVGDDVTLGDDVQVRPGTVIGAGAVVLAGAVVAGEVPPRAVVGASSAREAGAR